MDVANHATTQVIFMALLVWRAAAQDSPIILEVDVENYVAYTADVTDPTKLARSPVPSQPTPGANFFTNVILADITQLNGDAVKGTMVLQNQTLLLNPKPAPGGAIADVTRVASTHASWEFLNADGSQLGSIYATGLSGGTPPPGSPASAISGNLTIVGGTGAFLGARGSVNSTEVVPRSTSQAEDPSLRRSNGGGHAHFVFQIPPMTVPSAAAAASKPKF